MIDNMDTYIRLRLISTGYRQISNRYRRISTRYRNISTRYRRVSRWISKNEINMTTGFGWIPTTNWIKKNVKDNLNIA